MLQQNIGFFSNFVINLVFRKLRDIHLLHSDIYASRNLNEDGEFKFKYLNNALWSN